VSASYDDSDIARAYHLADLCRNLIREILLEKRKVTDRLHETGQLRETNRPTTGNIGDIHIVDHWEEVVGTKTRSLDPGLGDNPAIIGREGTQLVAVEFIGHLIEGTEVAEKETRNSTRSPSEVLITEIALKSLESLRHTLGSLFESLVFTRGRSTILAEKEDFLVGVDVRGHVDTRVVHKAIHLLATLQKFVIGLAARSANPGRLFDLLECSRRVGEESRVHVVLS
jgi:hypothetical protein